MALDFLDHEMVTGGVEGPRGAEAREVRCGQKVLPSPGRNDGTGSRAGWHARSASRELEDLMTYARIEQTSDLPPEGAPSVPTRERLDLDFKLRADRRAHAEHAKDLAAFANALGGVVLVGAAHDDHTGVLTYPGLQNQSVGEVKETYDKAAAMCSPRPWLDAVPVTAPCGAQLVAVNVEPQIHQIIAAPAGPKTGADHAWKFPLRVGAETDFLRPEELPMYMDRDVRRAYLLLMKIPEAARASVVCSSHRPNNTQYGGPAFTVVETPCVLGAPSLESNAVPVALLGGDDCRVPLRDILDVWEEGPGTWRVRVHGWLLRDPQATTRLQYHLNPRVT